MLKRLELSGFKSFAKKTTLTFDAPITSIVGPNGSGKSNVAEAFRWGLGEQSLKSLRGKRGEDLIFNGSGEAGRLNRASVSIVFDNAARKFPVDFDEVTITREVFRDGSNEYLINGSKVRLRDIYELMSAVSLGATGHHIISQGEADRILNANIFERRTMIEEALGLRLYQWKLEESRKKLDKTEENIKQVESLRREIAPHLKFLHKQVEKIEKADEMRRELGERYREYLKKEENYLEVFGAQLREEKEKPGREMSELETRLAAAEKKLAAEVSSQQTSEREEVGRKLQTIRSAKDEAVRKLGRLEGMIEIRSERVSESGDDILPPIPAAEAKSFITELDTLTVQAEQASEITALKKIVSEVRQALTRFWERHSHEGSKADEAKELLAKLLSEKEELVAESKNLEQQEKELATRQTMLEKAIAEEAQAARGAEREVFQLRARRSELRSSLEAVKAREERWQIEKTAFQNEIKEAAALVNQEILRYKEFSLPGNYGALADRPGQEERRRAIEKIKIRLEDMGVEGTDVLQEYKDTQTRDEFLAREHDDLLKSKDDLQKVIIDLLTRLDVEFHEGLKKINLEFQKFFHLMFGGGTASLEVMGETKRTKKGADLLAEMEEEKTEEGEENQRVGIDINVSLPRKKIHGLQMLSGGERALTSIALLFAVSQVNPPPFLILDETDAALDEANSRKYGDMIESLSKYSQLIVISHNRETMSRAGVIYGVTMGADAVSRLLSIKFDQAAEFAK